MGVLFNLNTEDPNNPDVLILGGAGTVSLDRLKTRVIGRLTAVQDSLLSDLDEPLLWASAAYKIENSVLNDLKTIIAANDELKILRTSKSGIKSRGIKKP
jgi:hypothetical protein